MTIDDMKVIIQNNHELMLILKIIDDLNLQDCWLCAGTLRNFFWNYLSAMDQLDLATDIDVIFYDDHVSRETTSAIEKQLLQRYPQYQWELKNQVDMHPHSLSVEKYHNSQDAMSKFPEKCTAIGARLHDDQIELFAPYGIEDIINFSVQPPPFYLHDEARRALYNQRVQSKDWQSKWNHLAITLI